MRVDLAALASFSKMGDEGGERAADALETLTGVPTHPELTRTTLVDRDGLTAFLGDADTRFAVEFDGALSGRALVSFDDAFAEHAAEQFPVSEGVLQEVSNILTSGFIDIWAADAETTIDIEPPEELAGDGSLVHDDAVLQDCAFVFESTIRTAEVDGRCRFAVVPDAEPFFEYLSSRNGGASAAIAATAGGIQQSLDDEPERGDTDEADQPANTDEADQPADTDEADKTNDTDDAPEEGTAMDPDSAGDPAVADLSAYIRLSAASADAVATHLAQMTGEDVENVESHLDFVPVERVPSLLDDAAYEGAVFESEGVVDSVIAVLFEESEAEAVAEAMLPTSDPDPSMAESAVAELGNVTASGFFDHWANTLDTTIDISTPAHVHDDGQAVLDTVAAAYGRHADTISVVDTTVDLGDDVTCRVVAFPSPEDADAVAEIATELADVEGADHS